MCPEARSRSGSEPAVVREGPPSGISEVTRSDHQVGALLVPGDAAIRKANPSAGPQPYQLLNHLREALARILGLPGRPEDRLAGLEPVEEVEINLIHRSALR